MMHHTSNTSFQSATQEQTINSAILAHHDGLIHWLQPQLQQAEDAEAIAQESYRRLLKATHTRSSTLNAPLLQRVALNTARQLGKLRSTEPTAEPEAAAVPQPEPAKAISADTARLTAVVQDIPQKSRQVFLLNRVKGMSYPQIARHCGISVTVVEKHMATALRHCLNLLS